MIQNANAYEVGLMHTWEPIRRFWENRTQETEEKVKQKFTEAEIKKRYTRGVRNAEKVCPDTWNLDCFFMNRPGRDRIQSDLLYDYKNNLVKYPEWHAYFRQHQPSTLIVWGKDDPFFGLAGARAYKRDLRNVEEYYFDTGHFALEEQLDTIAERIVQFHANKAYGPKNQLARQSKELAYP